MLFRLEWQNQIGKIAVQEKRTKRRNRLNLSRHKTRKHKDKKRKGRAIRSVSSPRFVETLLVADHSMMEFHEDRDVETYLLTIMNMVLLTIQE